MLHQKPQRYISTLDLCCFIFVHLFIWCVHFSRKIVFTIMNLKESGACMVNRRVTAQTLLCAHWFVCLLLQQFNRLIHFIFTEKHCIQSAAVVPLQTRNSKFTECCMHLIYIKRFLRIDVCAMQECSMHVCECIHFRLDLLEGFFLSVLHLCCSYARMIDTVLYHCYFYYTDEIFMSIASNITFFPSIHSVYISFKLRPIVPDRNCYWVLYCYWVSF